MASLTTLSNNNNNAVTIIEEIKMPSSELNKNLIKNIFDYLKKNKENTCNKTHGVIRKIISFDGIIDSRIGVADASNCFTIKYTIEAIKPVKDLLLRGKVLATFDEGLFVEAYGIQLIITDGKLNLIKNRISYDFNNCRCSFVINDLIDVIIKEIDYKDGKYFCIAIHRCDY